MNMAINKPVRTALEVYHAGYQNRRMLGYPVKASREFFLELRNAICYELERKGYCTLIDWLLEYPPENLDVVVYTVFRDLGYGYPDKLADVRRSTVYRDYMPHVNNRWLDCSYKDCRSYIFDKTVVAEIEKARDRLRKGHQLYLKKLEEKERLLQQAQAQTKAEETAKRQAQQIVAQAQQEAERINQSAQAAAENILAQAQAKAEEMAKRQGRQIVAQAQQEAERINQSAQAAAENILAQAQAKAEETAKDTADKLVSRYIRQAQQELKQECDASVAAYAQENLSQARTLETIHGEMCDKTNALQANWIKALDSTLEQLNAAKADFYQHLHQWQVALYPRELKPLAERYLELYRILNVEKLLREEMVFQADTPQAEPAPSTVEGLHKLNKTLTTFLRRFEAAMDGLGLYAYYPEVGEQYDDIWHISEDEDEECYGKTIQSCIVPGIAKKASDGGEDDMLIPAVVKLNA